MLLHTFAFLLLAQVPTIVGDTVVSSNAIVKLSISKPNTFSAWVVVPNETTGAKVVSEYVVDSGTTYVFSGYPGKYNVIALTIVDSKPVILKTIVTISSDLSAKKVWVVAIVDQKSPDYIQVSNIFESKTIKNTLLQYNASWKNYDLTENNKEITTSRWGLEAIDAGLPRLMIINDKGETVRIQPLPSSEAEIINIVKGLK